MEYVQYQWPSGVMAASKTTSLIAQLRYFMHVINHAISILVQRFGFLPIFPLPSPSSPRIIYSAPSWNIVYCIYSETPTSENRRIENFCTVSRHCRFRMVVLNAKMGFVSPRNSFPALHFRALYPFFFHTNYHQKNLIFFKKTINDWKRSRNNTHRTCTRISKPLKFDSNEWSKNLISFKFEKKKLYGQ